jgi:hypothetical protein
MMKMRMMNCSENDNRPEFEETKMMMKIEEEKLHVNGYKIVFGGAKDIDEKGDETIRYVLDCSMMKMKMKTKTKTNDWKCDNEFELIVLSKASKVTRSFDQIYDQLAIEFHLTRFDWLREVDEIHLKILALEMNSTSIEMSNAMEIVIELVRETKEMSLQILLTEETMKTKKWKIDLNELKFVEHSPSVNVHPMARRRFRLLNLTRDVVLNNDTNELIWLKRTGWSDGEKIYFFELTDRLLVDRERILLKLTLIFGHETRLDEMSMKFYSIDSSGKRTSSSIVFNETCSLLNMDLSSFQSIEGELMSPNDSFSIRLINGQDRFHLQMLTRQHFRLLFHFDEKENRTFLLIFAIEDRWTLRQMSSYSLQLNIFSTSSIDSTWSSKRNETNSTLIFIPLTNQSHCQKDQMWFLKDENDTYLTSLISRDDRDWLTNDSTLFIDLQETSSHQYWIEHCLFDFPSVVFRHWRLSRHLSLCSTLSDFCYRLTFHSRLSSWMSIIRSFREIFSSIRSIEFLIFISFLSFLFFSILFLLLYRCTSFSFCLHWKNFLFYGKKYRLSQMQRLSTGPTNVRRLSLSLSCISISISFFVFVFV